MNTSRRRARKTTCLSLAFLLMFVATAVLPSQAQTEPEKSLSEEQTTAFRESVAKTAVKLLPVLQSSASNRNLVFSPVGLTFSASLLMNGADDKARKEFADVFGLSADLKTVNAAANSFAERLLSKPRQTQRPKPVVRRRFRSAEDVPPPPVSYTRPADVFNLETTIAISRGESFDPGFQRLSKRVLRLRSTRMRS